MAIDPVEAKIPLIQADPEFNTICDQYLSAAEKFFMARDNLENVEELRSADREFHQLNFDLVQSAEHLAGPDASLIELSVTLTAAKIDMCMRLRRSVSYSHLPKYFQTEMLAKFGGAGLSKWVDRLNERFHRNAGIIHNIQALEDHGLCDEFAASSAFLRGFIAMRLLPRNIQFFKEQIAYLEGPNAVAAAIQRKQAQLAPTMNDLRTAIASFAAARTQKQAELIALQQNIALQHTQLVEEAGESPLEAYIIEVGENVNHPHRQLVDIYLARLNAQDALLTNIQELISATMTIQLNLAETEACCSELKIREELQDFHSQLKKLFFEPKIQESSLAIYS